MESKTNLFTQYPLLELKNRVVMAPMTRCSCNYRGEPTKELENYYLDRAENDVGLIVLESAAVNENSAKAYVNGAQLHENMDFHKWSSIINKCQSAGSKIWIQLYHAGRLTVNEITNNKTIAPSAIKCYDGESYWRPKINNQVVHFQTKTPYPIPLEMSEEQIQSTIKDFSSSCKLACDLGFDGIELHGAHGYLLHQFSSKLTNRRTDKYSASGLLFIKELVEKCLKAIDGNAVLSYRISCHMVDNPFIKYDESIFDIMHLVETLDKLGVNVFHSSELKAGKNMLKSDMSLNSAIRSKSNKPIIVCGGITDLEIANELLLEDSVNLIGFGRSLISNPDMIRNFKLQNKFEFSKFDYNIHMQHLKNI